MSRSSALSYNVHAKRKAIDRIRAQSDEERSKFILETFDTFFHNEIRRNPAAFRGRFRKMAASTFNFYRGSAVLFYQDLKSDKDPFIAKNPAAGQIFIHVSTRRFTQNKTFSSSSSSSSSLQGRFTCSKFR